MVALLGTLLVLALAAHLVCVNVAATAPLIAIYLDRRGRRKPDPLARELGYALGRYAWWGIGVGGGLGIVCGLLMAGLPYARWFAALGRIPDYRLHWLAAELVVYLLLLLPFTWRGRWHDSLPWLRYLCGVLAATNLLYHFPPMFAILSVISSDPAWIDVTIDRRQFHRLMLDPAIVSRTLHHWFAATATIGMLTAWLAWRSRGGESQAASATKLVRIGAGVALVATLMQIPTGLWFLLTYPPAAQGSFLGGDLAATGLLGVSVVLSVGLLHHLAMITLGDVRRTPLIVATALLLTIIVCMSAALHRGRHLDYLREAPRITSAFDSYGCKSTQINGLFEQKATEKTENRNLC
ncbi:MAG: hypothetical protein WD030_10935 [Pirellulales bacterium]